MAVKSASDTRSRHMGQERLHCLPTQSLMQDLQNACLHSSVYAFFPTLSQQIGQSFMSWCCSFLHCVTGAMCL